jgi:transcriptional regulator with GAF, ATPase, and Fis domain
MGDPSRRVQASGKHQQLGGGVAPSNVPDSGRGPTTTAVRGISQWADQSPFWLATTDPRSQSAREAIAIFEAHGFRSDVQSSGNRPGILLCCDEVAALQALDSLTAQGADRVIAVWVGRERLPPATCWRMLDRGAADVLYWSGAQTLSHALSRLRRWQEVDTILESDVVTDRIVGRGRSWRAVLRQVVEAARFSTGPMLLTGETGTGKELIARLIHDLDPNFGAGQLVVIDCTTVVPTLSGSEFFGHERGAFTDAVGRRDGAFAMADGGTLFLDELGDLPAPLQAELLRVIQEGTFKRVCATNRDLESDQQVGNFRADLYHRVASTVIALPPLRERREDIEHLFRHFLTEFGVGDGGCELDAAVRDLLLNRQYPGNIRDLRQFARRIASRHVGSGPISVGDIPDSDRPVRNASLRSSESLPVDHQILPAVRPVEVAVRAALADGLRLREIREQVVEAAIRLAVADCGGSLSGAAARLGVTSRALQQRRANHRTASATDDQSADPVVAEVA